MKRKEMTRPPALSVKLPMPVRHPLVPLQYIPHSFTSVRWLILEWSVMIVILLVLLGYGLWKYSENIRDNTYVTPYDLRNRFKALKNLEDKDGLTPNNAKILGSP